MKINYYCPNIVRCIADKLKIRIFEVNMKSSDSCPSQEDVKNFDKIVSLTAKKIINTNNDIIYNKSIDRRDRCD